MLWVVLDPERPALVEALETAHHLVRESERVTCFGPPSLRSNPLRSAPLPSTHMDPEYTEATDDHRGTTRCKRQTFSIPT